MIIGISGQKRSGKDTVARVICDYGYELYRFADPVRECLEALDPLVEATGAEPQRLSSLLEGYSWEMLKFSPYADDIRGLLQRMGTEVGRNSLGADTWVDIAADRLFSVDNPRWVISDCRFSNEAELVHSVGGVIVHVSRPDTDTEIPYHDSELIDFGYDELIVNQGTVEDLELKAKSLMYRLDNPRWGW